MKGAEYVNRLIDDLDKYMTANNRLPPSNANTDLLYAVIYDFSVIAFYINWDIEIVTLTKRKPVDIDVFLQEIVTNKEGIGERFQKTIDDKNNTHLGENGIESHSDILIRALDIFHYESLAKQRACSNMV